MSARSYLKDVRHYVYRHFDADGVCLYVGCSHNVQKRFKQHMFEHTWWALEVARTRITVHPSRDAGRAAEKEAIVQLEPLHNGQKYWTDMSAWSAETFLKHGRAQALQTWNDTVDRRSAIGRIYVAYSKKFGRDLFEDMGEVATGFRNIYPHEPREPRVLRFAANGMESAA